jgi:hypothetical protein
MTLEPSSSKVVPDSELVASMAKLWPHREHESNWLKSLFCTLGLHRWRRLNLDELVPGREVHHCFWCSKIRIDGLIYR